MKETFRRAELEDVLDLVKILSAAVDYKQAHDDQSWGSEAYSEREVRGLLKSNETYVLLDGGEIVATFGLTWDDPEIWGEQPPNAGYLHRMAVKSSSHGQGIGQSIIGWVEAEVARRGKQFLRLDCDARNEKLCRYYESQGFRKAGQKLIPSLEDYYANLYEKEV